MTRLAINGGEPVREELLPYGSQSINESDIESVTEVLRTDWITQGPKINEFEDRLSNYCGAEYGVAFSSGTTALHAACSVAGIEEGDEVITSPLTFAATANAIVYNNGTPVFADIDPDTLTIDPEEVEQEITEDTKALIPVDFAGHPCDYDRLQRIAEKHDLTLITDAAHALGAEYREQKTGTLADMTMFSFHPVKHITTGEGGMIVTDNETYYRELKKYRHHGITKNEEELNENHGPWYYEIHEPGHNFRITDMQCALGMQQLNRLDEFVERRREISSYYHEEIGELDGVTVPMEADFASSSYHIYPLQFDPDEFDVSRKKIFMTFRTENIGVQVHYVPVHYQPYYREQHEYEKGMFPNTETYYRRAVTIPLFPKMKDRDVEDVIRAVRKIHRHYWHD